MRYITKLSDNEPYDAFIQRVKPKPLAVAVKINDLTDNMDIRRLSDLTENDAQRLRKYLSTYHALMNNYDSPPLATKSILQGISNIMYYF